MVRVCLLMVSVLALTGLVGCSGSGTAASPSAPPAPATASPEKLTPSTESEQGGSRAGFDVAVLPKSFGRWTFFDDLVYYRAGHIATGDDEIVALMQEGGTAREWADLMEIANPIDIPGGFCGTDAGGMSYCLGDTARHGLVLVMGQSLDASREVAQVVLPLL